MIIPPAYKKITGYDILERAVISGNFLSYYPPVFFPGSIFWIHNITENLVILISSSLAPLFLTAHTRISSQNLFTVQLFVCSVLICIRIQIMALLVI